MLLRAWQFDSYEGCCEISQQGIATWWRLLMIGILSKGRSVPFQSSPFAESRSRHGRQQLAQVAAEARTCQIAHSVRIRTCQLAVHAREGLHRLLQASQIGSLPFALRSEGSLSCYTNSYNAV